MIGQRLLLDFILLENGRFVYRPAHVTGSDVTGRDSERFIFFHTSVGSDDRNPFYCETFFGVAVFLLRAPQGFVGGQEMR